MTTIDATLKPDTRGLKTALAIKLLAAIVFFTLVMAVLMAGVSQALAGPVLRNDVRIDDEAIRLGDVFEGLEQHADFVLAPAPQPGQEIVWNEPTLKRIVTAFNLPLETTTQEVRIRRAGTMVDDSTIKSLIRDYLTTEEPDANYTVTFSGAAPELFVPGDDIPMVEVADLRISGQGGTFSAIIKASDLAGNAQTVNVRGVAEKRVMMPVLTDTIETGKVISKADIEWASIPAREIRKDMIADANLMIGATPRRTIAGGKSVRAQDLETPKMVARGDLVTMVFRQGPMMLTARGRALEDGVRGDVIKVSNTNSNRVIQAKVTDLKQVTVTQ